MQKFRSNAEPATVKEEQNNEATESVFDKLFTNSALTSESNEENDRNESVVAVLPPTKSQQKPVKKKIVSKRIKI